MSYTIEQLLYKPKWYKEPTHSEKKEEEQKQQRERQEVLTDNENIEWK
jgi:hypothetical protein